MEKLARHWLGFLVSGSIAFCVDATILHVLSGWLGLPPILARIGSISVAMVVAWLSHRRLTFGVTDPPSRAEFLRYAAVAWFSAGVNYLVFVLAVLLWPQIHLFYALVLAAIVAMFVSYVGMRFAAFRLTNH